MIYIPWFPIKNVVTTVGVMTTKFLGKFGELVFILRNAFIYRGLRKFLGDCYTLSPSGKLCVVEVWSKIRARSNRPQQQIAILQYITLYLWSCGRIF